MKVVTIFGTRPEIIRLSLLFRVLDGACDHVMVHTGQNYDPLLSDVFLRELGVRDPDHHLGVQSSDFASQIGALIPAAADALRRERPDRVLILGDTNSALAAIVAARMGIPVFHLEAGNRCFDDRVPEEINRRIVDHSSSVLLPYTHRSKENLVREGIERDRIFVVGNPIHEVLDAFESEIDASDVHRWMEVEPGRYFLVTMHRAENVDEPARLQSLLVALEQVATRWQVPVIVSVHPRTASRLSAHGLAPTDQRVRMLDPLGFFDFVRLEKSAMCVITDSGTVQEECAIFRVPNVTIRDVTERPETQECGSNILAGAEPQDVISAVALALASSRSWNPPEEYLAPGVSETVAKILLGRLSPRVLQRM